MMKIAIGCDHAGVELKDANIAALTPLGHEFINKGTDDVESVDYPDFGRAVSEAVASGDVDRGVLICGTGIGMSIVANKFPGIRAALCFDLFTARMSRLHNNANILVLGSRVTSSQLALAIAKEWIDTEFEGNRHQRRLDKITEMEGIVRHGTETIERH